MRDVALGSPHAEDAALLVKLVAVEIVRRGLDGAAGKLGHAFPSLCS